MNFANNEEKRLSDGTFARYAMNDLGTGTRARLNENRMIARLRMFIPDSAYNINKFLLLSLLLVLL